MTTSQTDLLARLAMARLARVDPIPYDPRTGQEYALIRVLVDSRTDGQVFEGHVIAVGENVLEIYDNQLDGLRSLVEPATADDMARVQSDHEHHVAECTGADGTPARNTRAYIPSIEASFRHVMRRDILPLRSVEPVPAPRRRKTAEG